MTDHPNTTDYRNLAERNEAFWREIAGELAQYSHHDGFCATTMGIECDCGFTAAIERYTAAIGEAKP